MRNKNYEMKFREVANQLDSLKGEIQELTQIICKMGGCKHLSKDLTGCEAHKNYILTMYDLPEDFKKMKELTKCKDYEYKITPETKKLVKKVRKQVKDE